MLQVAPWQTRRSSVQLQRPEHQWRRKKSMATSMPFDGDVMPLSLYEQPDCFARQTLLRENAVPRQRATAPPLALARSSSGGEFPQVHRRTLPYFAQLGGCSPLKYRSSKHVSHSLSAT